MRESAELPFEPSERIVFYDGVCGLCNRFVQWVLKLDTEATMRFAPLQGSTAEAELGERLINPAAWTIVYRTSGTVLDRSTAALTILRDLKWGFGIPALALMVPRIIRDAVYNMVAKMRYRTFGQFDSCPIPSPAVRTRFLP